MTYCRLVSVGIMLASLASVGAQTSSTKDAIKRDYSQEAAVIEELTTKVSFDNDGNLERDQTTRVRVQTDAGVKGWGVLNMPYQSATQTVDIEFVRVRKPDGSTVVTSSENVQDLDSEITRSAPFYSDLREKHVAVKGLGKGDILEYEVRWHSIKPLIPGQFWFQYNFHHDGIVLGERIEIKVPAEREVKVKGPQAAQTVTSVAGSRVYAWSYSNLERSKESENDLKKQVETALGRLPPADVQISSFQSWEEVGRWYWNLQKERIEPTAAIRAKAAELTKGMTDDDAKMRALYSFVSTQYRYIGIAFGIGRYQPHAADDVLTNNYGDCKDKHTLLAALLQASGITIYPALINSRQKFETEVPSPAQFDHVIGYLPPSKNRDAVWFDSTPEVAPLGLLLQPLRDKQALVIVGEKAIHFVTTPADPPFASREVFKIDGKLSDDGTLEAKVAYTSRGDGEVLVRTAFRQLPQPEWKDLVQQISYALGYSGTVSDVNASQPEAVAEPFHFSYSYNRKDYPTWKTDHQFSAPGLPFIMPAVRDDTSYPVWLGPAKETDSESSVQVPMGYTPQAPANVDLKYDFAEYHASYTQNLGVLTTKRRLLIKMREVPVAEFDDYRNFLKSLQSDVNRYVQTSSSGPMAGAMPPSIIEIPSSPSFPVVPPTIRAIQELPQSTSDEANRLVDEARDEMAKKDFQGAMSSLYRAVEADPKYTRAWIALGQMLLGQKQISAGTDAFRKAMAADPDQRAIPKVLGLTLMANKDLEGAAAVWQDYIKAHPDDVDGPTNLGNCLAGLKRYAEAAGAYEVAISKGQTHLEESLGLVYLRSGQIEKGTAVLQKLADSSSDPGVLNDIAYELAESNTSLTLALKYAQHAVEAQEKASHDVDLSNLLPEDLTCTLNIGFFWDTLGWIHFRLGHLDQAEDYLRAAWLLQQQPEVADHLGQVYEQQKNKEEAIHMYRLALSTPEAHMGSWDETRQRLEHLTGQKEATGPELLRADSNGTELGELRTAKLKLLVPGSATAEFFLIFEPGAKIEKAEFISGSEELKSAAHAMEEAHFQVAFPTNSSARLVRRAVLSCSPISGCNAVLFNPNTVKSVK